MPKPSAQTERNTKQSPLSDDIRRMGSESSTEGEKARAWAHLFESTYDYLVEKVGVSIGGLDIYQQEYYAQEALLRAFEKAHQYRKNTDASARGWLRRIAINIALNDLRQSPTVDLGKFIEELAIPEEDQLDSVEKMMIYHDLKKFLNTLSDRDLEIIEMHYYRGKAQVKIAEEFNLSAARINQILKEIAEKARRFLGLD